MAAGDLIGTREAQDPGPAPPCKWPPKLPSPAHLRGTRDQTRGVPLQDGDERVKEPLGTGHNCFFSRETIQTWELALATQLEVITAEVFKVKTFYSGPHEGFLRPRVNSVLTLLLSPAKSFGQLCEPALP